MKREQPAQCPNVLSSADYRLPSGSVKEIGILVDEMHAANRLRIETYRLRLHLRFAVGKLGVAMTPIIESRIESIGYTSQGLDPIQVDAGFENFALHVAKQIVG
jgi:hypothetical protein